MTFEEYIPEWYKHHPLAASSIEKTGASNHYDSLSTLIVQKLDWIEYCNNNGLTIDSQFEDTLFEDLKLQLGIEAAEGKNVDWGGFADFFRSISQEKAKIYDGRLVSYVNELLKSLPSFDKFFHLYFAWASGRIRFLEKVGFGMPSSEAGWFPAFYKVRRKEFLEIRGSDFQTMMVFANYFLALYEHCKAMDRQSMAGDIVKVHDFVTDFMRDVYASARSNGYYEYEEKIRAIIESLKAETDTSPSVFISYTWDDEVIVNRIEKEIRGKATVLRDKNVVEPGDSIRQFMKSIRKQDFVILVVSDKYLESRNCMYEVLQLLKDYEDHEEEFWNKVILFVTATGIYDGPGRAEKIRYWTDVCSKFENTLSDIPKAASEELAKEAKILRYISMEIEKLLEHASDKRCDRELDLFIQHLTERVNKWAQYGSDPYTDAIMAALHI